jgi:hypothetical protein
MLVSEPVPMPVPVPVPVLSVVVVPVVVEVSVLLASLLPLPQLTNQSAIPPNKMSLFIIEFLVEDF